MCNFKEDSNEEALYLKKTLNFITQELNKENQNTNNFEKDLINSRKNMWQETSHSSSDLDKIPEMNHYLSEINIKSSIFEKSAARITAYKKMLSSPYFGRIDFKEDGFDDTEKIYIGMHNLLDENTDEILVYDWRSPVASMFYEGELGQSHYNSPIGIVSGNISLKRQYKIQDSKLIYFFDSSLQIKDSMLQEILSKNSSDKMKNIVQTIQKDQDVIIRDTENELLIVQGCAGSGKTSIALHRIAFLLYIGMSSNLSSNNFIIISPNSIFSKYISGVLPELGEENVNQITYDEISSKYLNNGLRLERRNEQLEDLILSKNSTKLDNINFKGSTIFLEILNRFIDYYLRKLIPFADVYYNNKVIYSKDEIKNMFLNNKIGMAPAKRLKRIENIIFNKIHPIQKERLKKIEVIVKNSYGHELEVKSFSRLLSIKETKILVNDLSKFTRIDYLALYKLLFFNLKLFKKLCKGLALPSNINEIIEYTRKSLSEKFIPYEDCTPIMYLKLKFNGLNDFSQISHVVIDEAQDYYPFQFEIFKLLFPKARYTILGDFNQAMENKKDETIYEDIDKILHKNRSLKLFLNKGYRSSMEINLFAQKVLGKKNTSIDFFERHENKPEIISLPNEVSIYTSIVSDIERFHNDGFKSISIICRTHKEAKKAYAALKNLSDVKLIDSDALEIEKGTLIIPSYMAKGLEFDAVIILSTFTENYTNEFDKRLLYVACTRALHRLKLYYIK
ncbi:HelD family protein [Clostridium guangxiense]|uniref:HelD family protein n=1 Tax=Clostridium guangxiense TaxID=1662055 RepID=UPI001E64DA20|nr:3'-5' exonuclease [Clostridium guangxiense]MCD2348014.1 AAA family ATPase [Clostridium guangxiense]